MKVRNIKLNRFSVIVHNLSFHKCVESIEEIPKLKFVSIKLKPQDVESSSIGTALGSYRNYTHILQEFQYGTNVFQTTTVRQNNRRLSSI